MHPIFLWRTRHNYSQAQAAKILNLKQPTLSRYESGKSRPGVGIVGSIERLTGIPRSLLRPDFFSDSPPTKSDQPGQVAQRVNQGKK
ncbi:MAG: helix-turn-helix transcriptional regulator [Patescibacteria group bacterium]|nr:helix-turn-helix transcriptional regulator [Patescibacteria group bacterium]